MGWVEWGVTLCGDGVPEPLRYDHAKITFCFPETDELHPYVIQKAAPWRDVRNSTVEYLHTAR